MPEAQIVHSQLPTVAIVGRPNVGKSTLFNRIVGRRKAVVLDTPGVTRDRNFEVAEWEGRRFNLVDTGGYETEPRDITFDQMRRQSLMAIQEADVVLFLTDVRETDNPVDQDVVNILRRSQKPVIIAANKCDNTRLIQEAYSFYNFGIEDLLTISAANGTYVAELLDRIVELLPERSESERPFDMGVRIAVVGRPNVGKSTLINSLLGYERVVATPLPGTTRDTIDTTFRVEDRIYTLIDTAGLRRRGKIERGIEKLSAMSAEASVRRSDVVLLLIDADEGLTDQDAHIAGMAAEAGRGLVVLVNKWDLVDKDSQTAGKFVKDMHDRLSFVSHCPVVMVSALTGQRVHRILAEVDTVYAECTREVSTSAVNDWLRDATARLSPPWHKGRQLRIKYVTQTGVQPPTFRFFVNNPQLLHFSYERYLSNQLREAFGFNGTPIRLQFRRKSRKFDDFEETGETPEAKPRSRRKRDVEL